MRESESWESEECEPIEVDSSEGHKLIKAGEKVIIDGLSACLGMIIYDPESQQAVAFHIYSISDCQSEINEGIETALTALGPSRNWTIYCSGNSPSGNNHVTITSHKQKRNDLRKLLKSHGVLETNITEQYNDDPLRGVCIHFDTKTGVFNVESYELPCDS